MLKEINLKNLKTKFNLDIRGIINVGSYISSEYKQNILTRVKVGEMGCI